MTDSASDSGAPRKRRRRSKPATERPRCAREGCFRTVRPEQTFSTCSFLCTKVAQELEHAQRISQATGDREHWLAVVTLNDALTDYFRSDTRLYKAAQEVGITSEQWHAIKSGA